MVEKFFGALSAACRAVDPNHLNLGVRYHRVPPAWALEGMRSFDVFSMNCYETRVPAERHGADRRAARAAHAWSASGTSARSTSGCPPAGIGHVRTQADRGRAFRVYTEDAAAKPWCVGVHYFTLYDQSALGRFDGECYNIGFLDVCNRPYTSLAPRPAPATSGSTQVAIGRAAAVRRRARVPAAAVPLSCAPPRPLDGSIARVFQRATEAESPSHLDTSLARQRSSSMMREWGRLSTGRQGGAATPTPQIQIRLGPIYLP